MDKLLLLGDEAIAQGALDGGLSGIYAYPGTPSTEITEYVQASKYAEENNIHREWSANEKTAMEAALGMSYAGKRSIVCMKHVGLNVAADPFINAAITGTNGGMIIVSADDPSMHSSQNEQDSRFYGKFAMIPILEPSNQQEAYEMTYHGFELSESLKTPVLLRITTRLAHSRSGVSRLEQKVQNEGSVPENKRQFVLLPAIARKSYSGLLSKQVNMEQAAEESQYNQYFDGKDKSRGIIACGIAYNYLMENFRDSKPENPILKISQYPLPRKDIALILEKCDEILVIEDGYPLVEEMLRGYQEKGVPVKGRLDGSLPRTGELNPNSVAKALGIETREGHPVPEIVRNRPPAMCQGCGHIEAYTALNNALEGYSAGRVFSDIGCYTLGALPPYNAINSCVDMGASITMAKGAADAGLIPSVAVIGDSTFTHSGMTGLLDCVMENSPVTIIISDNFTTAMTGGQDSHALGKLEDICAGIGVKEEHIRVFRPTKKNIDEMTQIIKDELEYEGVSVIIPRRQCVQTMRNKKLAERLKELNLK
ncbi:MAG: thiamine pyrophosphate-dependent enzyme [Bacteroidales bacterium]